MASSYFSKKPTRIDYEFLTGLGCDFLKDSQMRVLFFCADTVAGPVRIIPLLEELRNAGELAAYAVVDRNMAKNGPGSTFDVLVVHRNPSERQLAWLLRSELPFLYDIDDLLLSKAAGLRGRRAREQEAIRWCLNHAQLVTSPSCHLLARLADRVGKQLAIRAVYLPNSGLRRSAGREPVDLPKLLWVSSHGHDYDEFKEVAEGVAAAARVIGTEVFLVGRFARAVTGILTGAQHLPWIEPQQFPSFLSENSFIAAAPMPVDLASEPQEFVDCKSDIKAAQYSSLGIVGLYSPALPYRESDLRCRLAAGNSATDWERGIMQLAHNYAGTDGALAQHPAVTARRPDLIAQQLLALLRSIMETTGRPFDFRVIATPTIFRRVEQRLRSLRAGLWR
jgi:hypothetical protein